MTMIPKGDCRVLLQQHSAFSVDGETPGNDDPGIGLQRLFTQQLAQGVGIHTLAGNFLVGELIGAAENGFIIAHVGFDFVGEGGFFSLEFFDHALELHQVVKDSGDAVIGLTHGFTSFRSVPFGSRLTRFMGSCL